MNKLLKVLEGKGDNYILPFFWQHGETEEVLRTYMKVMHEANIGAVCVESRPHPDYCGPKWWEDMDVILDEARKRGMKVWILDDSHFPTGFANGAMENAPLALARKSICCKKMTVKAGETLVLTADEVKHPGEAELTDLEKMIAQRGSDAVLKPQKEFTDDELAGLSAVSDQGQKLSLKSLVTEDGINWTAPAEGASEWTVYQMNVTRNRGPHKNYINMTDGESVRVLIDAVYEPHWDHYKDDFGTTIEGFFSDEPELGNGHLYDKNHFLGIGFGMDYPWSREMETGLREIYGDDLELVLPFIWETEGCEAARAQVRYDFMDVLTRLVEKNFSFQLGDWCRAHGVKYIGHMIEDNGQHARTGSTLGHYFRGLAGEDWGGIDDIGGQVYPLGEDDVFDLGPFRSRDGSFYHYMLGKLANSAAAIDTLKKGRSMCEIFGAYGWSEGVQLEKYLADHFMCRGVNHYVPHAFSPKAFPDPDCPPHFYAHGHNPQIRHFGELMRYMNNVCELISDGIHKAPVAIIYPGEGEWTGKNQQAQVVAKPLCEAQIDYDFIPQDVFLETDRYKTVITDGALSVNGMTYEAVLVPYMQYITAELAENITALRDAGVKVIFAGEAYPEGICGHQGAAVRGEAAEALLKTIAECQLVKTPEELPALFASCADVVIDVKNRYVHYYHYIHEDGMELYMLINEGAENWKGQITLCGKSLTENNALLYDAWTNTVYKPQPADGSLQIELVPRKSVILVLPADEAQMAALTAFEKTPAQAEGTEVMPEGSWTRQITEGVSYPVFGEKKDCVIPDNLAKEEPEFSGYARYENGLIGDGTSSYVMEITDASEGVEVFVNGQSLGIQIVKPYIYDLTPAMQAGSNTLVVEVATTLERATAKFPNAFGMPTPEPTCGSGITGELHIYKR